MRKLIVLLVAACLLMAIVPSAEAWVHHCVAPVVVVVSAGGSGGGGWIPIVMEVAVLAVLSPYLIMYNENPQCRKEPTIGDMSNCVQKIKK